MVPKVLASFFSKISNRLILFILISWHSSSYNDLDMNGCSNKIHSASELGVILYDFCPSHFIPPLI